MICDNFTLLKPGLLCVSPRALLSSFSFFFLFPTFFPFSVLPSFLLCFMSCKKKKKNIVIEYNFQQIKQAWGIVVMPII